MNISKLIKTQEQKSHLHKLIHLLLVRFKVLCLCLCKATLRNDLIC